ncbi:formamidopyrimidine-DNA glycosylase [Paenibacillus shirakamiensis]|uniref:Formamidopyrimidine-DNA glycosylase n=1 Tax=Paenibacillus shirakamiensis TaxID=1265935 RepID=A0ABS4JDJ9_9BACL|nr:Fpg/Nei family DNA glycosylase [Paenibacillus shirakamiensis]MBP1999791.1 formamidopyrimidine-DNA glycosylase [Paenibacillus shirakamiensis]
MPELPEMDNYRRLLSHEILDTPITDVAVHREKSINVASEVFIQTLVGHKIIYIERRGKHLLFHLDNGRRLLLHLMLGGLMYLGSKEDHPDRTTQIEISFGSKTLYFIGLRLGYLHLHTAKEIDEVLADLGPDLFDRKMNEQKFIQRFAKRRGALKSALINQHVIAGIGNCYADEIVFEAKIQPSSKLQDLTEKDLSDLYHASLKIIHHAIDHGGYIELPLTQDDKLTGGFNDLCQVYDRGGEPCLRCEGTIERAEIGGRKVFFCPKCQDEK